jgi:signal transduction histidine kinase
MWSALLPKSYGARLAAVATLLIILCFAAIGLAALALTELTLRRNFDRHLGSEAQRVLALAAPEMIAKAQAGTLGLSFQDFRLETIEGVLLAGSLAAVAPQDGWYDIVEPENAITHETDEGLRAYRVTRGGFVLTVADDIGGIEDIRSAMVGAWAGAAVLAALLALATGMWLSRLYMRRLSALGATAKAIAGGATDARMPVHHGNDAFDRVSQTLNQMLDRNESLIETHRQTANGIAHDLRTPLTRLRNTLESAARRKDFTMVETAIEEIDEVLDSFAAMLRIAEIEERRFVATAGTADLNAIANKVWGAYEASFEDAGGRLLLESEGPQPVPGDAGLLLQALSNLVENALIHTPPGSTATIRVSDDGQPILAVEDNGPGVPKGEEKRIQQRFYRPAASAAKPGHGLGLSLVAAVAKAHGAEFTVTNLHPGLRTALHFGNSAN